MLKNYFCKTPLESSSVFWNSEEFFNPKQLRNLMLADRNFNENFTGNFLVWNFQNVWNNIHNCSCWQIYRLLLKVNSLQKKVQGVWFFEEANRNKKSKFLLDTLQSKKKECKKHSQVFLKIDVPNRKILENETTGEVPGWRPALHLL